MSDELLLGERRFTSRLVVGTGKYKDFPTMQEAIVASGAQMVTVAVRRLDLQAQGEKSLLHWIPKECVLLPNAAGCFTADEAVRTLRLARELEIGGPKPLVKLEVLSDPKTLRPDGEETLRAARTLIAEGFTVLPYCSDDPVLCRKLEEAGCAAVMPLGAPIGSGLGLRNPYSLQMILEQAKVPVIVDAGVGTASDCALCMELGVSGLLVNTAISGASDPVAMARAMKLATEAGRLAYLAGRIPRKLYGSRSSPLAVAIAAGADGLHLPARGLSSADARALGIGLVGVSAHSAEDVARASREGADFAVFAPVYDTPGKSGRGEAALASACRAAPIPVLALGGVDETNARRCIEAGALGVACIRSVLGAAD